MAKENVFDKEFEDQREKNNLEGLLEQLNLPPAFVTFVKEHKRSVQAGIALIIIVVVAWSLYGSYRDRQIRAGVEALSSALELSGTERVAGLEAVAEQFSGTPSAVWAEITIGQELMRTGAMDEAVQIFAGVRDRLSDSSPLMPLIALAVARAEEALSRFDASAAQYEYLKGIEGYRELGYLGLARLQERQGNSAAALEIYEAYLAELDGAAAAQRLLVEERIAVIKGAQ